MFGERSDQDVRKSLPIYRFENVLSRESHIIKDQWADAPSGTLRQDIHWVYSRWWNLFIIRARLAYLVRATTFPQIEYSEIYNKKCDKFYILKIYGVKRYAFIEIFNIFFLNIKYYETFV